jgi:hypothetical protein
MAVAPVSAGCRQIGAKGWNVMTDRVQQLSRALTPRLRALGHANPNAATLYALLHTAYLASLRTEEGRFVKTSLTFANPQNPHSPPPRTRAHYARFSKIGHPQALTPSNLTKLARAVDQWSGSIAVWGTTPTSLVAWGIVDQLVGTNVRLHREGASGFASPGILTIMVDGVADLSVYHGDIFLGGMRADSLIRRQNDAFHAKALKERIVPHLSPIAAAIAKSLDDESKTDEMLETYFELWSNTVARLCIGLRRLGTGGALLITPSPASAILKMSVPFGYRRLGESLPLEVLDQSYHSTLQAKHFALIELPNLPMDLSLDLSFAQEDLLDRRLEVSGATKLVTSLAAVDGLVLMTPELYVRGFGVKIGSGGTVGTVYDGAAFLRHGTRARTVDVSRFGTRHTSMLRYCRLDPRAVGVVISQDGAVRMMMVVKRSLTFWDNVKLLGDTSFSKAAVEAERHYRRQRASFADSLQFGYTKMPKSLSGLMRKARRVKHR